MRNSLLGSFTDLVVDQGRGFDLSSSGKADGTVLLHPPHLDVRRGQGALGLGVRSWHRLNAGKAMTLRQAGSLPQAQNSPNSLRQRQSFAGPANGCLKVLAAPKLLDEGIDVPAVDLGRVMTASRSRRQMVQRLGRVIPKKDDGRPLNFVIIVTKDTVEDPSSGVHEGFFDLVGDVATNKIVLEPGWTCSNVPA